MTGRTSGLLWPTVSAGLALVVLLGLGTWQWQRLYWKLGLIAQIESRVHATPVPLASALEAVQRGDDLEYTRVSAKGRWMGGREDFLWAPSPAGPGWHVYAPLKADDGTIVIVNRGFVPDGRRDPASRPEQGQAGEVSLVGLLRKPEKPGLFTPDNDVAKDIWYWRDLDGMAKSMLPVGHAKVAPFFLDAERGSAPPPAPQGGVTRLNIPNSHLQYVVTWYGLAATLIGVYVAFVLGRLREQRDSDPKNN